ncbi:hypothetical protein TNCV_234861 [Trichonephila clavipes]|uniref:Uncharacterized protein n=1 Tax=Trichonephila clavipes TaxID=2585209 RepID=A0A8X6SK83_TRICX|nr:hypothetical protein TNCV_234861 [Trichonephila clavipes]
MDSNSTPKDEEHRSIAASMLAMTLGLQPSGFGFESRVRLGCIFIGEEVGLSPEMDARLERKRSTSSCYTLGSSFVIKSVFFCG